LKRPIFLCSAVVLALALASPAWAQSDAQRGKASTTAKTKSKPKSAQPIRKVAAKTLQTPVKARKVSHEVAPRPSFGQLAGLHAVSDELALKSSVAYVIDQDTQEVLLSKNDHAVLPIASITKLMTGLIVSEAKLDLDEPITITQDDVDTEKGSSSRLKVGATLSRGEMLHLALMSSENRAAHALGRTYPGGMSTFVRLMNAKAVQLGMKDTRYVEPTGLSSQNQSSARDLAVLVSTAYNDPLLRDFSTSTGHVVEVGRQTLQYRSTNRLISNPHWDIGLQRQGTSRRRASAWSCRPASPDAS